MEKAMLSSNCNHVQGDDTNNNGFQLMIPDPDDIECSCNCFKSNIHGNNLNVQVSSEFIACFSMV